MSAGNGMSSPRALLHSSFARAGPVARPNLREAGEGVSLPDVENWPLVNVGNVHTRGQCPRELWVSPFGKFCCMRGGHAGVGCCRDLWEV